MSKFKNSKRESFLIRFPSVSLDSESNNLTYRMKFNFSYFDCSQSYGEDIKELEKEKSNKLIKKLIEFSRENLKHWKNEKIGSGNHKNSIYVNYGDFPQHSNFKHPSYIPHQVLWGRFRLDSAVRLVGFVVSDKYDGTRHVKTGMKFDKNTFYIVFLDSEHNFYPKK